MTSPFLDDSPERQEATRTNSYLIEAFQLWFLSSVSEFSSKAMYMVYSHLETEPVRDLEEGYLKWSYVS